MVNGKKVTIKDVAAEAGVSIATVSYVVNNLNKITDKTKMKVNLAIEKLRYEPNILARSLVKNESRIIGVVINTDLQSSINGDPFFQEFINGVESRSKILDYSILMIAIDNEEKSLNPIKNGTLAGIIILGHLSTDMITFFSNLSIPVVVADQEKTSSNFIYIGTEDEKGAFLAVEYLISKGHKNIGLLGGKMWAGHVHRSRFEGYRSALQKYNIVFKEEYIFQSNITYEGGIEAAQDVAKKVGEMTAIFCTADIIALGLIKGLHKKSIFIPKDLSIIGFDNIKNSKYFIPELTTISQNIFKKGTTAMDLIVDALNGKTNSEIKIPVELIERESVIKL